AEELADGTVRVENLSQKQPVALDDDDALEPGAWRCLTPPARLTVGDTVIDVESAAGDHGVLLETVARPWQAGTAGEPRPSLRRPGLQRHHPAARPGGAADLLPGGAEDGPEREPARD